MRIQTFLIGYLFLSMTQFSSAQDRPARPPAFKSVEVAEDRSISLRIWAPNAKEARIASSDLPGANPFGPGPGMTKGENGVWEGKISPVAAGSYRYSFNVDGLTIIDPRNPATSESNSNTFSLLHVPGSEFSDEKQVPHGAVAQVHYFSKTLDRNRRAHVYTPPGYESGTDKYPVLYLLHGASDCDASWSTVGRAGFILDNLIAAKKAKPMIVVMPMGHTGPFSFGPEGNSLMKQMEEFRQDFTNELRPLIEERYRTLTTREHRAVAGLSMGGAQTIDIAINNLNDYGYVGVFSSGVFGITGNFPGGSDAKWEDTHAKVLDDAELKKGLQLVWFATGKDDFLLATSQETVKVLKAHGFKVDYEETEGGHTWINWREHYLPKFVQQLFTH